MTLVDLTCPHCSRPLVDIRTCAPGESPSPSDIFLCGECSAVSFFTPEGMTLMTEEQFNELTPAERRDFRFAIRDIRARHRQNVQNLQYTQAFLANSKN